MKIINRNSKLYNTLWYIFGSLSYGFTSLIYMIIITRIIGIEVAGQFSFAFAVSATFYVIGVYYGSAFQVTDISNNYSDTDYLYNRLTSIIIMVVATLIFSVTKGYHFLKVLLIMMLVLYRSFDAFLDSYHAIIQKRDKIYKVGILTFFRTLLLVAVFFIVSLLFKNILYSIISILIVDLLFTIIFEYKIVKKLITKSKYNKYKNLTLFIEGFSVFAFTFLAMYILNAPKYAIDAHLNNSIQGIFGIIFMPSSFMSLLSLYLIQPFLNEITTNVKEKNINNQNKLILKLSLGILLIGLFITFVAYLIGIPVLELLYGVKLVSYRIDLVIIMLGTIFYSVYCLLSAIIIALRKNLYQVISLLLVSVFSMVVCNYMVVKSGIRGASLAYLLVMLLQVLLYIIVYLYLIKRKTRSKRIAIRLMGGLGNQMFQYAMIRSFSIKYGLDAYIDLRGITNKTHNVYGLNHCNISSDVKVVKKTGGFKANISYLLYGLSWVLFKNNEFYSSIQPVINKSGIYCVPLDYIRLNDPQENSNYMVGYFASNGYVNDYCKEVIKELQIKDKLAGKNSIIAKEMVRENSVCIHVRKGDYVGSMFDVCTIDYYMNAYKLMKKKIKNAKFYVFSDNIKWVKDNLKFDDVTYIDWKNNQYEDLKLMSTCKNFIISNSTFSWWAQFLSSNDKKIVIAPSYWYRNGTKCDLYEENWILINPKDKAGDKNE